MTARPQVSICIPTFNGERFIVATLKSIQFQTLSNYEVIILDDNSKDGTAAVVRSFLADSRIRFFRNCQNLGISGNWKKVLSYAEGKYVKLLGQDDLLSPECLRRQVAILEDPANASVVLAVCNRIVINSRDNPIFRRPFPFAPGIVNGSELIRASVRCGTNVIGEPVVGLFRRESLDTQNLFASSDPYFIDLALWKDLLKRGDAFIDPAYLTSFRISGNAATARIGLRQSAFFRSFVRSLWQDRHYYRLTWVDAVLGIALSFQWCILRNLIVRFRSSSDQTRKLIGETPYNLAGSTREAFGSAGHSLRYLERAEIPKH